MTPEHANSSGSSGSDSPPQCLPRRSPWPRRIAVLILVLCFLFLLASSLAWARLRQWSAQPLAMAAPVAVTIPRGASLEVIARDLGARGVLDHPIWFIAFVWSQGKQRSLQAGDYTFSPHSTPGEVLARMQRGSFQRRLTIPEGWTAHQIAQALLKDGWTRSAEEWLDRVAAPVAIDVLGFELPRGSEGFCFPDTYFLEAGTSPAEIHARMLRQFARVWSAADPSRRDPRSEKLTELEVVTLASMIEREARSAAELPAIASVYLNRLKIRMKLQCCATVHYALGEVWDRELRRDDLKLDSPYNTYRHYGLPPGPICNPGREAIEAVLRPADTDFLYYVYRGDGTHEFTRTYREHMAAARKYLHADPNAALVAKPELKSAPPSGE